MSRTAPSIACEETGEMSADDTFELLSNRRRRYALHHLKQAEEAELGELSRTVASWEYEKSKANVTAKERKRVYTSLQQFHLPKLEESDVVEYDDRSGEVRLGPRAEEVDVYLEVVEGRDIPWSQYYLGLAGVNAALLSAAVLGAVPVDVPEIGWAAFTVTTLALSACVHTYYTSSSMQVGTGERPPVLERSRE